MAMTPSSMLPLGTMAPNFRLQETGGRLVGLDDYPDSKGYLIMFICNHCPFVQSIRKSLSNLTAEYMNKGIAVFGINSNDVQNYPADNPEKMREEKKTQHYQFPYLFDETQEVAKAYQAACTPDFYLFDAQKKLVYRGQYDGSRPGTKLQPTGADLKAAMDAVLMGKEPSEDQRPSIGCNIKWKS
jgi:peroxiredoxin